jgi:hypothetical protein
VVCHTWQSSCAIAPLHCSATATHVLLVVNCPHVLHTCPTPCCAAGKHTGSASHAAADTLTIQLTWPEPYGGVGLDTWRLVGPDELHVTSSITVKGQTVQWRQVYKRSP